MIVDDLRLEPAGDRAELSARLRLESPAEAPERIWFRFPQDMVGEGDRRVAVSAGIADGGHVPR